MLTVYSPFPTMFNTQIPISPPPPLLFIITKICGLVFAVNPLRDMPILGSSNSDAKKKKKYDAKIWTNGDTII